VRRDSDHVGLVVKCRPETARDKEGAVFRGESESIVWDVGWAKVERVGMASGTCTSVEYPFCDEYHARIVEFERKIEIACMLKPKDGTVLALAGLQYHQTSICFDPWVK
jgi:hypothetical protein